MPYSINNRRLNSGVSRRGASLIEVLVALVLLVVGIYSIARLFPGGFFSLRSAQNSDVADRLAQEQLEQLKQNNNFLLDAVYMYSNEVGFFSDNSNVLPNAAGTYTPPGGTVAEAALADINKARYISGESFTVPSPNTASSATNGVSVHVLNDGPVVVNAGALAEPSPLPATPSPAYPDPAVKPSTAPVNAYAFPPVHSGPWTATTGTAPPAPANYDPDTQVSGNYDLPTDLLASGRPNYVIDYNNEEIAVPSAPYDQRFTLQVALSYPASGTGTTATPAETVTEYLPLLLPAANATKNPYPGTWFNPQTAAAALDPARPIVTNVKPPSGTPTGWVVGSAVLTRTLTQVQDVPTLTGSYTAPATDPYTYVVYSDATSDMTNVTGANLGVLAINPRLQGQTVSVSYLAYDWHVIREDQDVPTTTAELGLPSTQSPIHLTIDHLKRVGDVQDDQTVNPGLFRTSDLTANTTGYDIVVLDTDTGQSIGLSAPAAGTAPGDVYDLDNQNGPTLPSGNTTEADPGSFLVSYQNGYITLPNSTDYPMTATWAGVQHKHVRIFYAGDYNWAVALQKIPTLYTQGSTGALLPGQYAAQTTGSAFHLKFLPSDLGQTVEVDDIHYTDTSGTAQSVSTMSGAISTDYADSDYVDVGAALPNVDLTKPITIGVVRGISARSVVIWKERGQWKSRSVSTILNQ